MSNSSLSFSFQPLLLSRSQLLCSISNKHYRRHDSRQQQKAEAAEAASQSEETVSEGAAAAPASTLNPPSSDEGPDEDIAPRRISRNFQGMFCSACRRATARDDPQQLIECTCCHRVFHAPCYKDKLARSEGRALPDQQSIAAGQPWFHSGDCEKVHRSLRGIARRGEVSLPLPPPSPASISGRSHQQQEDASGQQQQQHSSRTWRLILPGSSSLASASMGSVHGVLANAGFRYGFADLNSFDAAALIRVDGQPACAAVLDVHGADAAELFVVGTRRNMRNQGLCKQMVKELSGAMGEAGVRRLVVPVDAGEEGGEKEGDVWQKLGFQSLDQTELRKLGWTLPAFSTSALAGADYSFMAKKLGAPRLGFRAPWKQG